MNNSSENRPVAGPPERSPPRARRGARRLPGTGDRVRLCGRHELRVVLVLRQDRAEDVPRPGSRAGSQVCRSSRAGWRRRPACRCRRSTSFPTVRRTRSRRAATRATPRSRRPKGSCSCSTIQELEGVIAHELAHVKHRDILISSVAATVAAAIMMVARMAQFAAMFGGGRQRRSRWLESRSR